MLNLLSPFSGFGFDVLIYVLSRTATETFAHHWVECLYKQKEACLRRCCSISQVNKPYIEESIL